MRDRRNTTIMVVDDDPSMRITLAVVIEDEGFGVVRAKDGRQAIEIARKMPISVISLGSDGNSEHQTFQAASNPA